MNTIWNRKILTFPFDPSSSMKAMFSFWVSWLILCIAPFSTSKNRKKKEISFFLQRRQDNFVKRFSEKLSS